MSSKITCATSPTSSKPSAPNLTYRKKKLPQTFLKNVFETVNNPNLQDFFKNLREISVNMTKELEAEAELMQGKNAICVCNFYHDILLENDF